MVFPGFIGAGYQNISKSSDGEVSINFYPELVGGPGVHGKSPLILVGTPGLRLFATLPNGPVRCLWSGDNRMFAVGGAYLWEILGDGRVGSYTPGGGPFLAGVPVGFVGNAATPAQIFSNGNQLFIVSGSQGYLADGLTVTPVVDAVQGAYLDTYFLAQQPAGLNTQSGKQFKISGLLDGTTWDPLDFASAEGSPENIVGIIADHEELWIFKLWSTEVWVNNGAANFPFQRIQGAFIEQGCIAAFSIAKVDNSVFWLGGDQRGAGVVWRAVGYTPTRISNHAVEQAIQGYSTISDAVAYAYQEAGHTFYVLHFPTARHTWVYDVATQMWHERLYWNTATGQFDAHLGRFHCYAFGGGTPSTVNPYFPPQHFVGDHRNGNIYVQSLTEYSDNGHDIRRVRSSPHVNQEMHWMKYGRFALDLQTGVIPAGFDRPAKVTMQISNDGGYTWGNEQDRTFSLGEYPGPKKLQWFRGGRSRDRCYRVIVSDPIPWVLVEAYLDVAQGDGA